MQSRCDGQESWRGGVQPEMKSGTFQDGEVGVTLPPRIIEVKSGSISNGSYLSSIVVIFHFHDYWRKSTQNYCNTSMYI